MSDMLEPVETEKSACALDRMKKPKNAGDDAFVRGITLENDELQAGRIDMFGGLHQKIIQQLVHDAAWYALTAKRRHYPVDQLKTFEKNSDFRRNPKSVD
jgi:hypothetical protein